MKKKKDLFWVGSSKKDLSKFPNSVQETAVFALGLATECIAHHDEKVLKGFGDSGVRELRLNDRSGTFRVVYVVKLANAIYVLHAFQKKSKKGIETTKQDIELIHQRLQLAMTDHKERFAKEQKR